MSKYLLGFDCGTQGSKGIIVDYSGRIVATGSSPHAVSHPKPSWAEHDAEEEWWGGFVTVVRQLLSQSGIDAADIAAIGCSAITPCMLPLDEDDRPLRKGILYGIDNRSSAEYEELRDLIDAKYAGQENRPRISQQSVGCRILWYQRNEPELFRRSERYMGAVSWIVYRLTGAFAVSHSEASGFGPMYDDALGRWDDGMCEALGIRSGQLPAIVHAHEIVGGVSAGAAKATGLKEGTPVTAGLGDANAEVFSTGARAGDTVVLYGSTMIIHAMREASPDMGAPDFLSQPVSGLRVAGGAATATSGSITRWFRDQFGYEESLLERQSSTDAYQSLAGMAAKIPAGSDGLILLPYFAGERSPFADSQARGMYFGLTLYHTKAHMFRAALEGIAYSLNHNIESMRQRGVEVKSLVSAGGGVKNLTWTQIMSDVTGLAQRCLPGIASSPGGNAYLAGYGIGVFKDMEALRTQWIRDAYTVTPDMDRHRKYRPYYEIYLELYENTKAQMKKLAALTEAGH